MKAKNRSYLRNIVTAFFFLAVYSSCKRDSLESINGQPTGPYASLEDFYRQNGVQEQTFTINPAIDNAITGDQGTVINLMANSLGDANGNIPAGNVTVTLKEIYSIKDMILTNTPTTSSGSILESGGMFYLSFTAGAIQYYLNSALNISMPSDSALSNMDIFFGMTDGNGVANWVQADSGSGVIFPDTSGTSYTMSLFDTLGYGWINCDQFYYSTPLTDVIISPSVTSERNEAVELIVYLAFPSINSIANFYGASNQQAVTAYNIPVGMQAAAVVIGTGRVTKKPYFGISMFTVTAGQPVNVSVVRTDEDDIISALQVL
jgi:hypothetical protein